MHSSGTKKDSIGIDIQLLKLLPHMIAMLSSHLHNLHIYC